jgi:hypothetical protein
MAHDIACSFLPVAGNYEKATVDLRSRSEREELLTGFYVSELLSLVVQNVLKAKAMLLQLYDRLVSHIWSLGMTGDKYAAFLIPLVESSLPEHTIRVWLRTTVRPVNTIKHVYSADLISSCFS